MATEAERNEFYSHCFESDPVIQLDVRELHPDIVAIIKECAASDKSRPASEAVVTAVNGLYTQAIKRRVA